MVSVAQRLRIIGIRARAEAALGAKKLTAQQRSGLRFLEGLEGRNPKQGATIERQVQTKIAEIQAGPKRTAGAAQPKTGKKVVPTEKAEAIELIPGAATRVGPGVKKKLEKVKITEEELKRLRTKPSERKKPTKPQVSGRVPAESDSQQVLPVGREAIRLFEQKVIEKTDDIVRGPEAQRQFERVGGGVVPLFKTEPPITKKELSFIEKEKAFEARIEKFEVTKEGKFLVPSKDFLKVSKQQQQVEEARLAVLEERKTKREAEERKITTRAQKQIAKTLIGVRLDSPLGLRIREPVDVGVPLKKIFETATTGLEFGREKVGELITKIPDRKGAPSGQLRGILKATKFSLGVGAGVTETIAEKPLALPAFALGGGAFGVTRGAVRTLLPTVGRGLAVAEVGAGLTFAGVVGTEIVLEEKPLGREKLIGKRGAEALAFATGFKEAKGITRRVEKRIQFSLEESFKLKIEGPKEELILRKEGIPLAELGGKEIQTQLKPKRLLIDRPPRQQPLKPFAEAQLKALRSTEEFGVDIGLKKFFKVPEVEFIRVAKAPATGIQTTLIFPGTEISPFTEKFVKTGLQVPKTETLSIKLGKAGKKLLETKKAQVSLIREPITKERIFKFEPLIKVERAKQIIKTARTGVTSIAEKDLLRGALLANLSLQKQESLLKLRQIVLIQQATRQESLARQRVGFESLQIQLKAQTQRIKQEQITDLAFEFRFPPITPRPRRVRRPREPKELVTIEKIVVARLDFPLFKPIQSKTKRKKKKLKRTARFQPSLTAKVEGITAPKIPKILTGIEARPIVRGIS